MRHSEKWIKVREKKRWKKRMQNNGESGRLVLGGKNQFSEKTIYKCKYKGVLSHIAVSNFTHKYMNKTENIYGQI